MEPLAPGSLPKFSVPKTHVPSKERATSTVDWTGKAKSFLEQNGGTPQITTTMKHFAQIQASTILRGSPLEGGDYLDSLKYWKEVVALWKSDKSAIPSGLTESQLKNLENSLNDLDDFSNKTTDEKIELIKQKLKENKKCYFPSGWSGTPGHFLMLKFELSGDDVLISPMTKGGGAEFHPVGEGKHKSKRAYKMDSIAVPIQELLETKSGYSFFARLDKMMDPTIAKDSPTPITRKDLYGLLNLIGELRQSNSKTPGVTGQRSGTCADAGMRMTLYEAVFESESEVSQTAHKRPMHAFKFQSLVDGFRQFRGDLENGDKDAYIYLKYANDEFLTRLNKLYPEIIDEAERNFCLAVAEEIQKHLKEFEIKYPQVITHVSFPNLTTTPIVKSRVPLSPPETPEQLLAQRVVANTINTEPFLNTKHVMSPTSVVSEINQLLSVLEKDCPPDVVFNRLYAFVKEFPLATGQTSDPFWDSLSSKDREACLELFEKMVKMAVFAVSSSKDESLCNLLFVMNSKLYDIACQIAPNISKLKISKKSSFEWSYNDEYRKIALRDADDYKTLDTIAKNFKKRIDRDSAVLDRHGSLFAQSYMLEYYQPYSIFGMGFGGKMPESSHYLYLKQFITSEVRRKENQSNDSFLVQKLAVDRDNDYMPPSYHQLHNLAYFAYPFDKDRLNKVARSAKLPPAEFRNQVTADSSGFQIEMKERNRNFVNEVPPLVTFAMKSMTENQIYLNKYSNDRTKIDWDTLSDSEKRLMQDIALIALEKDLIVYRTLDWAGKNLHNLRDPRIKLVIEQFLFQFGNIDLAFQNHSKEVGEKFQDFLHRAVSLFAKNPQDQNHLMWLSTISTKFETYVKNLPTPTEAITTPDFYKILVQLLQTAPSAKRKEILDYMIFSFGSLNPSELKVDDVANLLAARFKQHAITFQYEPSHEIGPQSQQVFLNFYPHLLEFINKAEGDSRNRILNQILAHLTGADSNLNWTPVHTEENASSSEESEWVVVGKSAKEFKSGPYRIDLHNFKVFHNDQLIQEADKRIVNSPEYIAVFGDRPFLYTIQDNYYYDEPSRNIRLIVTDSRIRIQKQLLVDNRLVWLQYNENLPVGLEAPEAIKNKPNQFWTSCENPPVLYVLHPVTNQFLYQYTHEKGWLEVEPNGKPTPFRVADLFEFQAYHSWSQYLEEIEPVRHVLLKEKQSPDGNWSVTSLNFTRLGLSFKMTDDNRLQCDQLPDFYLAKEPPKHVSTDIPGCIYLESKDGKRNRIIIPTKKLVDKPEDEWIAAKALPSVPIHVQFNHDSLITINDKPYFSYDVLEGFSQLKPESPNASLYLALLSWRMNNYSDALYYLNKSSKKEPDGEYEWTMVGQIVTTEKEQFSPAYTAMYLHLDARMKAHALKFDKRHFLTKRGDERKAFQFENKFRERVKKQQDYYSEISSDLKENVSAIPAELRLSVKQESEYLKKPKGVEKLADIYRPEIKINQQSKENIITSILLCPTLDHEFSDMVRLSSNQGSYLYTHFFSLYNLARDQNPEIRKLVKMDLLFLSLNDESETTQAIIAVLNNVVDNAEKFAPMNSDGSEREKRNLLEFLFFGASPRVKEKNPQQTVSKTIPATIAAPPSEKVNVPLPGHFESIKTEAKSPFGRLFNQYFKPSTPQKQEREPFVLGSFQAQSALAARIARQLKDGYDLNESKQSQSFEPKNAQELPGLKTKLESEIDSYKSTITSVTKQVEELANRLTEGPEHYTHKAKQLGKQVVRLTLENSLFKALLTQDAQLLKKLNPGLTEDNIQEIFQLTAKVLIAGRNQKIAENALEISERIQKASNEEKAVLYDQQAKLLKAETAYSIDVNPEYLIYEFATGTILRPDQVALLDWIFKSIDSDKLDHLMFQFQAGGGKTKVLMPIIAQKLTQKGYFPVLINYTPLYEIGKNDLDKSLKEAFQQQIEVLEIGIDTKLTWEDLQAIFKILNQYKEDKKSLVVRSETIYSLIIAKKAAFERGDTEGIYWISKIFEFLKPSVALIDEAHLTLDSLQETNQTTGSPIEMPDIHKVALLRQIEILAGAKPAQIEGAGAVAQKVRLTENQQALLNENDIKQIRDVLIEEILQSDLKDILALHSRGSQFSIKSFDQYLSDESVSQPAWLVEIHNSPRKEDKDLANTIVLLKRYLYKLMPHTLKMIQGVNYGDSIMPDDFSAAPRHDKKPTTSSFQDTAITAVLTIQNAFQVGISDEGLKKLINHMKNEHNDQMQKGATPDGNTIVQLLFDFWWGASTISLDSLDVNNRADLALVREKLAKHPKVIEHFLLHVALPQIKLYHEKISAAPPDLLDVFSKSISFTATPGLMEVYPHQLQQPGSAKLDLGFEAEVVQTLCETKNQKITEVEKGTLEQFFQQIYDDEPELFKEISTLIDSGALFRNERNNEVIDAFLSFCKDKKIEKSGGVFKQDAGGENEGQLIYKKEGKDQPLNGSDLPQAFKQIGSEFNRLTLVTLFGLEDTTGADYKQPDKGKAILTVGENQTKTKVIQAAMRMRRLLAGKDSQTVRWIIYKELSAAIPKEKLEKLTPKDIFGWLINNEAALMEKVIVMRAFQGIKHLMQKIAWKKIDSINDPQQKVDAYKPYRDGLVDHMSLDFFDCLSDERLENSSEVLNQYALSCYSMLGFKDDQLAELRGDDRAAFELILKQTTALIEKMRTSQRDLSGKMNQNQSVRQNQNQNQDQNASQLNQKFNENDEPFVDWHPKELFSPDFFDQGSDKPISFPSLKNILNFPDMVNSSLLENIHTYRTYNTISTRQPQAVYMRPVNFILVVREDGKDKYIVCDSHEAKRYLVALNGKDSIARDAGWKDKEVFSRKGIKRQAVLFNAGGEIVKNGDTNLGLPQQELDKLQQSDDFNKRIVLINFLNGRIQNLSILHKLTASWSDQQLDKVWEDIKEMKIGVRPVDVSLMKELKRIRKSNTLPQRLAEKNVPEVKKEPFYQTKKVAPKQPVAAPAGKMQSLLSTIFGKK